MSHRADVMLTTNHNGVIEREFVDVTIGVTNTDNLPAAEKTKIGASAEAAARKKVTHYSTNYVMPNPQVLIPMAIETQGAMNSAGAVLIRNLARGYGRFDYCYAVQLLLQRISVSTQLGNALMIHDGQQCAFPAPIAEAQAVAPVQVVAPVAAAVAAVAGAAGEGGPQLPAEGEQAHQPAEAAVVPDVAPGPVGGAVGV